VTPHACPICGIVHGDYDAARECCRLVRRARVATVLCCVTLGIVIGWCLCALVM